MVASLKDYTRLLNQVTSLPSDSPYEVMVPASLMSDQDRQYKQPDAQGRVRTSVDVAVKVIRDQIHTLEELLKKAETQRDALKKKRAFVLEMLESGEDDGALDVVDIREEYSGADVAMSKHRLLAPPLAENKQESISKSDYDVMMSLLAQAEMEETRQNRPESVSAMDKLKKQPVSLDDEDMDLSDEDENDAFESTQLQQHHLDDNDEMQDVETSTESEEEQEEQDRGHVMQISSDLLARYRSYKPRYAGPIKLEGIPEGDEEEQEEEQDLKPKSKKTVRFAETVKPSREEVDLTKTAISLMGDIVERKSQSTAPTVDSVLSLNSTDVDEELAKSMNEINLAYEAKKASHNISAPTPENIQRNLETIIFTDNLVNQQPAQQKMRPSRFKMSRQQ